MPGRFWPTLLVSFNYWGNGTEDRRQTIRLRIEIVMKQDNLEKKSLEITRQCPRYERCSVPICPLDLLQDSRTRLAGEPVCTLPKSKRLHIGQGSKLPRQGLTKQEWAARIRWQSLTEAERQCRIAKLRPFRRVIHGARKRRRQSSDLGRPNR